MGLLKGLSESRSPPPSQGGLSNLRIRGSRVWDLGSVLEVFGFRLSGSFVKQGENNSEPCPSEWLVK